MQQIKHGCMYQHTKSERNQRHIYPEMRFWTKKWMPLPPKLWMLIQLQHLSDPRSGCQQYTTAKQLLPVISEAHYTVIWRDNQSKTTLSHETSLVQELTTPLPGRWYIRLEVRDIIWICDFPNVSVTNCPRCKPCIAGNKWSQIKPLLQNKGRRRTTYIPMLTSGTNGSMEWRTAETSTMATESIHQTWYQTNAYHNASKMAQKSKTKPLSPSRQIPKQTGRGPTRDRVVCTYTRFLGKLYSQSATSTFSIYWLVTIRQGMGNCFMPTIMVPFWIHVGHTQLLLPWTSWHRRTWVMGSPGW